MWRQGSSLQQHHSSPTVIYSKEFHSEIKNLHMFIWWISGHFKYIHNLWQFLDIFDDLYNWKFIHNFQKEKKKRFTHFFNIWGHMNKAQIFLRGHRNLKKKIAPAQTLLTLSKLQNRWDIFSNFVAFSQCHNIKEWNVYIIHTIFGLNNQIQITVDRPHPVCKLWRLPLLYALQPKSGGGGGSAAAASIGRQQCEE